MIQDGVNETIFIFNNPILTVSKPGILIIQKDGIKTTKQVHDFQNPLQIPDELLFRKGLLHLILVDVKGNTYEGNFNIDGNTYCPLVTCFFCTSIFQYLSCLPGNFQYLIYAIFFILTGILLIYLRSLISLAWTF